MPSIPQESFHSQGASCACLSSIILSPLNGYVKMSPYETGDICIEPERIAASGGDFLLREGGKCVCPRPRPPRTKTPTPATRPNSGYGKPCGGHCRPSAPACPRIAP